LRVLLYKHVLEQGQGAAAIARLAFSSLRRVSDRSPSAPGPWLEVTEPPRGRALVHDYLVENGGDPRVWGEELPPHLFAQFGIPLAMRIIAGLPYPVQRTLNAGCAWRKHAPLPAHEPLDVRARLEALDDDGARVKATVKIIAGTATAPDGLEAEMRVFIPLSRQRRSPKGTAQGQRDVATVPDDARPVGQMALGADAGAAFAALTGDFNPIHWLAPAAWAAGFKRCILQGFAMHSLAVEALGATLSRGAPSLAAVDVKFARPLVLPAKVGVYSKGDHFWLGAGPGAPANLIGTYQEERRR
jgi:acyl dehydratase